MVISIHYKTVSIQGWQVNVSEHEIRNTSWPAVKSELADQFFRISRVVAQQPLEKLKTVIFWIHRNDPSGKCAAFNPSAQWLRDHGSDPHMAGGVEISNCANFLDWTHQQPFMVLHELAHAYNFKFMKGGFKNQLIKNAFALSMQNGKYNHVLHWDGKIAKAYATTNQMEYFAECTEAYFGQNDFFPFVNAELKTFDPVAYKLMQEVWGNPVE